MLRAIIAGLKYRQDRKRQEERATSLAVQLVLNGCLLPTRLSGCKDRLAKVVIV